jgi:hypothetical protein
MALTREEKHITIALKDTRFPTACVEGTYKGSRRVFICLMDARDERDPSKGYDMTPIAMLLTKEDMKEVKGHEDQAPGDAPKIILADR